MMKNSIDFVKDIILKGLFFLMLLFIALSCEYKIITEPIDNDVFRKSNFNDKISHNQGQNCVNCHKSGGIGLGWFKISGTVYDSINSNPYPNIIIRLYTGPAGTGNMIYELEGDSLGNFYSTEKIEFGPGLFPIIFGDSVQAFMGSQTTHGNCNGCHGITTNRIKLK